MQTFGAHAPIAIMFFNGTTSHYSDEFESAGTKLYANTLFMYNFYLQNKIWRNKNMLSEAQKKKIKLKTLEGERVKNLPTLKRFLIIIKGIKLFYLKTKYICDNFIKSSHVPHSDDRAHW